MSMRVESTEDDNVRPVPVDSVAVSDATLVRQAIASPSVLAGTIANELNVQELHGQICLTIADALSGLRSFQDAFPDSYVDYEADLGILVAASLDDDAETAVGLPSIAEQTALLQSFADSELETLVVRMPTGLPVWIAPFLRDDHANRFNYPVQPEWSPEDLGLGRAHVDAADIGQSVNDSDAEPSPAENRNHLETRAAPELVAIEDESDRFVELAPPPSTFAETSDPRFTGDSQRRIGDVVKVEPDEAWTMGAAIVRILSSDALGLQGLTFRNLTRELARAFTSTRDASANVAQRAAEAQLRAAIYDTHMPETRIGPEIEADLASGRRVKFKLPHPGTGNAMDIAPLAAAAVRTNALDLAFNALVTDRAAGPIRSVRFGDSRERLNMPGLMPVWWSNFETHYSIGDASSIIRLNPTFVVSHPTVRALSVQEQLRENNNGVRVLSTSDHDEVATCIDRALMMSLIRDGVEGKPNAAAAVLWRDLAELLDVSSGSGVTPSTVVRTLFALERVILTEIGIEQPSRPQRKDFAQLNNPGLRAVTTTEGWDQQSREDITAAISQTAAHSPLYFLSEVFAGVVGTPREQQLGDGFRVMGDALNAVGVDVNGLRL